jgi:hypothetical protein
MAMVLFRERGKFFGRGVRIETGLSCKSRIDLAAVAGCQEIDWEGFSDGLPRPTQPRADAANKTPLTQFERCLHDLRAKSMT